jgi:hypothetical protein
MEPEGSIPNSQELSTFPYTEPDQSIPYIIIKFLKYKHDVCTLLAVIFHNPSLLLLYPLGRTLPVPQ